MRPRATGWLVRTAVVAWAIQTAVNVARPLVTYRVLQLDGGSFEVGVIAATFSVLPLLAALPVGRWLDRRREPPVVGVGATAIAVSVVPLVLSTNLWLIALGCTFMGLGQLLCMVGLQTQIANNSPAHKQDSHYGMFTVFTSLGQIVGPLLGTLVGTSVASGAGHQVATTPGFLAAGGVAAIGTLATIGMATRPPARRLAGVEGPRTSQAVAVRRVLAQRGVPAHMYVGMALFIAIDLISVFLPALAEHNGVSARAVGVLLATRAAFTMLSRMSLTRLTRILGRGSLVRLSVLVSGVVLGVVPWLHSPVLLFVAMAVAGFPLGVGQPLTMSEVSQRTIVELRGTSMALRMVANRTGQIVIPAAVGAVAASAGVGAAFWMIGALLVSAGVLPGLGRIDSARDDR